MAEILGMAEIRAVAAFLHLNRVHSHRGWKSISCRCPVYRHPKWNLVLKRPGYIGCDRCPVRYRVPTIKVLPEWVLQPYHKAVNTRAAVDAIRPLLGTRWAHLVDLHAGNVRWTSAGPKLIDW